MEKIDPKKLARQIDAYLAYNAIQKSEFIKRTGISSATLSQWRNGKYAPSTKSIEAIENYTDMPIIALLNGHPPASTLFPSPTISDDYVTFPVIGDVAAGYEHIAYRDWTGDSIDVPRSWLRGREPTDYFVLCVTGDSMYPDFQDGDHVLVLSQSTMDRSGQVGVVRYGGDKATLKRVEYVVGEDWMTLRPINPQFPPITIRDEELTQCTVFGVAKMVIRELNQ